MTPPKRLRRPPRGGAPTGPAAPDPPRPLDRRDAEAVL